MSGNLKELRELSKKATLGPWSTGGTFNPCTPQATQSIWSPTPPGMQSGHILAEHAKPINAQFIVACVNYVRTLLAAPDSEGEGPNANHPQYWHGYNAALDEWELHGPSGLGEMDKRFLVIVQEDYAKRGHDEANEHWTGMAERMEEINKRLAAPTIAEIGIGDVAWGIAKQAIEEKWDDAKLGPAIAKFALDFAAERAVSPSEPEPTFTCASCSCYYPSEELCNVCGNCSDCCICIVKAVTDRAASPAPQQGRLTQVQAFDIAEKIVDAWWGGVESITEIMTEERYGELTDRIAKALLNAISAQVEKEGRE